MYGKGKIAKVGGGQKKILRFRVCLLVSSTFTNWEEGCMKGRSENRGMGEMAKWDDTNSQ